MDEDQFRIRRLFVMLTQIGMKRLGAGLGQQGFQHHIPAAALRKMLAIGFTQRANTCVAVLLVDAASRVTMPAVQTFLGHLALPGPKNCTNP